MDINHIVTKDTTKDQTTGDSSKMVTSRVGTGARGTRGAASGKRSSSEAMDSEAMVSNKDAASGDNVAREGGVGREGNIQREGGVGREVGADVKGGTSSRDITHTIAELSRRRLANDPAMMRELKRYRKLMLLTLLPAITSETEQIRPDVLTQEHMNPYHQESESPLGLRGQPDGTDDPLRESSEHLPRPEPTDGVIGAKSAGSHRSPNARSLPSGPASAGTRLPLSLRNSLDTSPRPAAHHKGHEESPSSNRSRRRSHGDNRYDVRKDDNDLRGAGAGELDLLTLAALYLESRQRVLGREWHTRNDLPNIRPAGQLGGMGVSRPRRLSPLSPTDGPLMEHGEEDLHTRRYSSVMPTPAGLHLSVNYTQNLGLDESMYLAERARAMRPRLRRLSSMDDLVADIPSSLTRDLHKATSAPDLSSSGHHGRLRQDMCLSRVSSQESLSPPLVTPARANTPTEATHSAALARPQIIGGSLATNSTVDTARTVTSYGHGRDNVPTVKTHLSQVPETSTRPVLPPPKVPFRSPRGASDPRKRDLPRTPPPTATGEGLRRGGRVHLEPLTARKISN